MPPQAPSSKDRKYIDVILESQNQQEASITWFDQSLLGQMKQAVLVASDVMNDTFLAKFSGLEVTVGCFQRTIARKTPALSCGMGSWQGIDQELTNFWAAPCTKSCPGNFLLFSFDQEHTKFGWLEVDKELDMGCQLLTWTFPCWNCRGLSCSKPLVTPTEGFAHLRWRMLVAHDCHILLAVKL